MQFGWSNAQNSKEVLVWVKKKGCMHQKFFIHRLNGSNTNFISAQNVEILNSLHPNVQVPNNENSKRNRLLKDTTISHK